MPEERLQPPREPRTGNRPEPRSLTLADLIWVVAGAAIGMGLFVGGRGLGLPNAPFLPAVALFFMVISLCSWLFFMVGIATSVAVIGRQIVFRRSAFAAEWISIMVALSMLREAVPSVDGIVNRVFPREWVSTSFGRCEWIVAAAGLVVSVAGIVGLFWQRRALSPWSKTLIAAAVVFVLLWCPIEVFAREGAQFFPAPPDTASIWLVALWTEARSSLTLVPLGLVYAVPITAALSEWRARGSQGRIRTEWPGPAVVSVIGLFFLVSLYFLRAEWPPDRVNSERIVVPIWIAALRSLSRFIVQRFTFAFAHGEQS
jgi:hypothetical protein